MMETVNDRQIKVCCAGFYEGDIARAAPFAALLTPALLQQIGGGGRG